MIWHVFFLFIVKWKFHCSLSFFTINSFFVFLSDNFQNNLICFVTVTGPSNTNLKFKKKIIIPIAWIFMPNYWYFMKMCIPGISSFLIFKRSKGYQFWPLPPYPPPTHFNWPSKVNIHTEIFNLNPQWLGNDLKKDQII